VLLLDDLYIYIHTGAHDGFSESSSRSIAFTSTGTWTFVTIITLCCIRNDPELEMVLKAKSDDSVLEVI
jgi:hypothetical protein